MVAGMSEPGFDPDGPAETDAGIFGLRHTPDDASVVLLPVPWDATTSYRDGAARAPGAILAASKQVDLYDVQLGRIYDAGVAMLPVPDAVEAWNREARAAAVQVIAAGGAVGDDPVLRTALARVNELGDRLNAWVETESERWLDAGKVLGLVGGDHSTPLGAIRATAHRHPGLGVLHIDAHADLRVAYEGFRWSHASIMHNVLELVPQVAHVVQVGVRDVGEAEVERIRREPQALTTFFDVELAERRFSGESWDAQCLRIAAKLPHSVYVSFDVDGLDPSLCPHTGTPVPGGLSFSMAGHLLATVVRSGRRIVGFDLNEVAPGPDGDEWDANVAARLLYKLVGWTVRSWR